MDYLKKQVEELFAQGRISSIAVRVGCGNEILTEHYKSTKREINALTRFDMASVSKILSVTQLALIAIDKGLMDIEDPVSKFYTCNTNWKIRNLLTHTIGIGHKNLCKPENNYENIGEYILSITPDISANGNVLYSCPAFILMGKILEKVFGDRLDRLFYKWVAGPLGMTQTEYNPTDKGNLVNANVSEAELGLVNDYNCRFLGGIAGNAGLFSSVTDLDRFCRMLLRRGEPLYSEETFAKAVQSYTSGKSEARGLGYLWVDAKYPQTGTLFPVGSIGHCGHTGQMVFADYKSGLYAIILTDATKSHQLTYGEERYDMVKGMRKELCNAIHRDLLKQGW